MNKYKYKFTQWCNSVFSSISEQDHPLNLIILGVYVKRWLKCANISKHKLTLTVRGPLHKKNLKLKKFGGTGKQLPVVILWRAIFYNIFILCMWLRITRTSDQGVRFMNFLSQIFFEEQSSNIEQKLFVAAFVLYGCGSLFLLWKGVQNDVMRAVIVSYLLKELGIF